MNRNENDEEKNSGYVVVSPLVTVRVPDGAGSEVYSGFYTGAILPEGVNEDDLDRHVRKGMVAEKGSPEADAATPFGDRVTFDDMGNPLTPQQAADLEKARVERRNARTGAKTTESKATDQKGPEKKAEQKVTGRNTGN